VLLPVWQEIVVRGQRVHGLAGVSGWRVGQELRQVKTYTCQMLAMADLPWRSVMSDTDRLTEMLMMTMSATPAIMSEVVENVGVVT
jgi:hypothetical protein